MLIEVQGGPLTARYAPKFSSAGSRSGALGKCRATVNKIGICKHEPCESGGRFTKLYKPWEFENGRVPKPLVRSYFRPYRSKPKTKKSPRIVSLTIRSSVNPKRVYVRFNRGFKFAHVRLTVPMKITVTCEVVGKTKGVSFFVQGFPARTDYNSPYSIAGDRRHWNTNALFLSPWRYQVARKVFTLSCKAFGSDGTQDWLTVGVSTFFKN